jgi:hypothetical protein
MQDPIQPIHQHQAGLFNTQSGKLIDLNNPTPAMISLNDIATGLANICRFGGQLANHYSVAEHTLLVWHLAPARLKQTALLHDASEAYLGDVIKPLKNILGNSYTDVEDKFTAVIFEKYNVNIELLNEIKPFDMRALEIENNYFRHEDKGLIAQQYEYRTILGWYQKPKDQLLALLNHEFMQAEIEYKTF